ncbi:VWA domain-containing protein [Roseibium sp. SCPC15]|uniref:VWA domain-containing protein n=1 Tax=Roseibium sp. SCP15 TaxID=3141376 RepID=UPI0033399527
MNLDTLIPDFSAFHFIRPWWLIALPAILLVWLFVRRTFSRKINLPNVVAPHLAKALTVGNDQSYRLHPIDWVCILLALLALGTAGPTWSRVPNPLLADTSPLVVVLKVSKSMLQTDIPPSRLERAKHKVLDLLKERRGAKTALVAYAGTAHQVVPLSEDPEVLKPFLEGLEPDVMPNDGETGRDALQLAQEILETQNEPGSIVFLLDRLSDADARSFQSFTETTGMSLLLWTFSKDETGLAEIDSLPGVQTVAVTIDTSDVNQVTRAILSAYQSALTQDERLKWRDQGYIFAWPAALLLLFWFRRGWTMKWAVLMLAVTCLVSTTEVRADGWRSWFLTPDQQGHLAFEAKEYQQAADLFEDQMWKAYSLYRLGRYEEAAELYSYQESSDAAMGEGMALIKSRSYRQAIAAFEKAVERDPDNSAAKNNLELARYILEYVETTREQSDTGEERGIGADDVVFDNEAGRGAESKQQQQSGEKLPESAEQWMRTVDTRTSDFLKTRFALEAVEQAQ